MRQNQTPAESKLWIALRKQQVAGLKFRRQHAIDRYIVDFYCHEMRLVIEVDGPTHDTTVEEDAIRQQVIQNQGITVLRFNNDEVFDDLPSVLERIMNLAGVAAASASVSNEEQASRTSALPAERNHAQQAASPPPRRTGRGPGGGV
jgi:very-short-patch-repair endonuclease